MKRNLFANMRAAIILAALGLSSCGLNTSPSGVLKSFLGALDQGRVESAIPLMSSGLRQLFGDTKLKAGLEQASKQMRGRGGLAEITIGNEHIEGQRATVAAAVRYKNGLRQSENSKFVKEPDGWKLALSK